MSETMNRKDDLSRVTRLEHVARHLAEDPERFGVSRQDAEALTAAVKKFRAGVQVCRTSQKSPAATAAKNLARQDALEQCAHLRTQIRMNKAVDVAAKVLLGIHPRSRCQPSRRCFDCSGRCRSTAGRRCTSCDSVHTTIRSAGQRARCARSCLWI
jgi:hypothetical protein